MGKFIQHISAIQLELNTAVLIVHHCGKDEARGQRGHSSLLGAIDAELEVIKLTGDDSPNRIGQLTVTKQKDGADGLRITYRLEVVPLSPIDVSRTSLVVVPADVGTATPRQSRKSLSGQQKIALNALKRAIEEDGQASNMPNIPRGVRCVGMSLWRRYFYTMIPSEDGGKPESKQKAFKRTSDALIANRTIGFWADYARITDG
jgi:hypothetical protein